ncbi:MAG: CRISPR-associated endonuclease Cas2 [Bdellovibrionales bacterium]|nr:CRISPR-associated endonuclease Cas2 [Bdellovibrionales bacterium]
MKYLSRYRIMWLFAFFDLPVMTKKQRKSATQFRQHLLDLGFHMVQFSVYSKVCPSKEKVEYIVKKISYRLPQNGKIDLLTVTDKQFENIISFRGKHDEELPKKNQQLLLF